MHLRTNLRPPGRYREEEDQDLPPNPIFVLPTIPFNPSLRPAVFPTLNCDQVLPNREKEKERAGVKKEKGGRRARVFRAQRLVPVMMEEHGLMQTPDGRWVATEESGEFEPYGLSWSDDDDQDAQLRERWIPSALSQPKHWSDLADGMRLVIVRELTDHMHFEDAILFLQLQEQELVEFLNLCADEVKIRALAQARNARIQEHQMRLIDSGDCSANDNDWGRIYDEELRRGDLRMPATFLISSRDVNVAKAFMGNFRFREEFDDDIQGRDIGKIDWLPTFAVLWSIQDKLELYLGVSTSFEAMDFGIDIMEYLPQGFLVAEEIPELREPSTSRSLAEIPASMTRDGSRHANAVPSAPFRGMRTPVQEEPPKKGSPRKDIETDGIENEPLRKPGRPQRSNKIVNGPSRLREVTNAADLGPKDSTKVNSSRAHNSGQCTARPVALRNIQNLARSPFKEFSSATAAVPKHSASFRDDIPAQPAVTSLPKETSASGSSDVAVQSASCTLIGPTTHSSSLFQDDSFAQAASIVQAHPSAQSPQKFQDNLNIQPCSNVQNASAIHPGSNFGATSSVQDTPIIHAGSVAEATPDAQDPQNVHATATLAVASTSNAVNSISAPQSGNQIAPTKIKFKLNGIQKSPPRPCNAFSAPHSGHSVYLQGKRVRNEEFGAEAARPIKKARLEQPHQPQQHIVDSIIGKARAIGNNAKKIFVNPFKGRSEPGTKVTDEANSFITANDSDGAADKRSKTADLATDFIVSGGINDSFKSTETQVTTSEVVTASNRSDTIRDPNGAMETESKTSVAVPNYLNASRVSEPRTPPRNFDFVQYSPNKSRQSSPKSARQGSVAKAEALSDSFIRPDELIYPHTPMNDFEGNPNPLKKSRKQWLSPVEGRMTDGKPHLHEVPAQMLRGHTSQELGQPPAAIEEKTGSGERNARTISQLSNESIDLIRIKSFKQLGDIGLPRLPLPVPRMAKVEIQIPVQKNATQELPVESSKGSRIPATKLSCVEGLPFMRLETLKDTSYPNIQTEAKAGATMNERNQRKFVRKPARRATPLPTATSEYHGIAGSSRDLSMLNPPAQTKGSKQTATAARKSDSKPKVTQPGFATHTRAPATVMKAKSQEAAAPKATLAKSKTIKNKKNGASNVE